MVHPILDVEHSLDTDPGFAMLRKPQKRLAAEFERLVASFDMPTDGATGDFTSLSPGKRVTYDGKDGAQHSTT
jgi:hypothetical protein